MTERRVFRITGEDRIEFLQNLVTNDVSRLSEGLVWVPVISFLQSVVDMVTAAGTPAGFGHVYAGNDYLDGWLALLEPHGATAAEIARIRERLLQEGL